MSDNLKPASHFTRARKKRLIEDVLGTSYSPTKSAKRIPVINTSLTPPTTELLQEFAQKLRNFLQLNKAHRWVIHEFFYSNIDQTLFGRNDFAVCLDDYFGNLKTRKLTRIEWCFIRRLLGKPRRCSVKFFEEERQSLFAKRNKIRLLQQRKTDAFEDDEEYFDDLPDSIPMPLVLETLVTARLRAPSDGLFSGRIDAIDSLNDTYRVRFTKESLGTHDIPDFEVMSHSPGETVPLSAYQQGHKARCSALFTPHKLVKPGVNGNDPMLGPSPYKTFISELDANSRLGSYPIFLLVVVNKLIKNIRLKHTKLTQLRQMNTEVMKLKSVNQPLKPEFQHRYAKLVLSMDELNKELKRNKEQVDRFMSDVAPGENVNIDQYETAEEVAKRATSEARALVTALNVSQGPIRVSNSHVLELISNLMSLLLHVKSIGENGHAGASESQLIQRKINEIKQSLDESNVSIFQDSVEMHMKHIISAMTEADSLHPFALSESNLPLSDFLYN